MFIKKKNFFLQKNDWFLSARDKIHVVGIYVWNFDALECYWSKKLSEKGMPKSIAIDKLVCSFKVGLLFNAFPKFTDVWTNV